MPNLTRDEIVRLSPSERLSLIGQLWDSMEDADLPLPESQRQELERRLATFDEDRVHAINWEELKAELAARST